MTSVQGSTGGTASWAGVISVRGVGGIDVILSLDGVAAERIAQGGEHFFSERFRLS